MIEHAINTTCPSCNAVLTGSTNVTGIRKPRPGDVSICFSCGEVSEFTKELNLQPIPASELPAEVLAFSKTIQKIKAEKLTTAEHNAFPKGRWS